MNLDGRCKSISGGTLCPKLAKAECADCLMGICHSCGKHCPECGKIVCPECGRVHQCGKVAA